VVIDGSFARGTDVVKAIALGADAVAMGRMYCYGLAAEGDAGVHRVLEILEQEITVAMALPGVTSVSQLDRSCLYFGAPVVTQPHVHSAFPLLLPTPEAPRG
jgi:glycolate oxidase